MYLKDLSVCIFCVNIISLISRKHLGQPFWPSNLFTAFWAIVVFIFCEHFHFDFVSLKTLTWSPLYHLSHFRMAFTPDQWLWNANQLFDYEYSCSLTLLHSLSLSLAHSLSLLLPLFLYAPRSFYLPHLALWLCAPFRLVTIFS